MDYQMKIGGYLSPYDKPGQAAAASAGTETEKAVLEQAEKEADVDQYVSGTEEKQDELDGMQEYLNALKQFKESGESKQKQPKQKVTSQAAAIRAELLMAQNPLMARMALGKAMRELSSLQMCKGAGTFENAQVERAIAQIKKVVRAGNMKVRNLSKEELEQSRIDNDRKRMELDELRQKTQELQSRRRQNRRKEKKESQDPANPVEQENPLEQALGGAQMETMPAGIQEAAVTAEMPAPAPVAADGSVSVAAVDLSGGIDVTV